MPETGFTATDLDLISFLKAIPDARMRRAGFVFLPGPCCCWPCSGSSAVAKACEIWSVSLDATMWCLARSWGFELQRPPSDSVQGLRHAGLRPGSARYESHEGERPMARGNLCGGWSARSRRRGCQAVAWHKSGVGGLRHRQEPLACCHGSIPHHPQPSPMRRQTLHQRDADPRE